MSAARKIIVIVTRVLVNINAQNIDFPRIESFDFLLYTRA